MWLAPCERRQQICAEERKWGASSARRDRSAASTSSTHSPTSSRAACASSNAISTRVSDGRVELRRQRRGRLADRQGVAHRRSVLGLAQGRSIGGSSSRAAAIASTAPAQGCSSAKAVGVFAV